MSTILFESVGAHAAKTAREHLRKVAQNKSLLYLFRGADPASLKPDHEFQVFTVTINKAAKLDAKDMAHTGSGCLLLDSGSNVTAGMQFNSFGKVESLEFGPLFTSLFVQATRAASDAAAPAGPGHWALLQAPQLHARALYASAKDSNGKGVVWPLHPMPEFLTPNFYTLDDFLMVLSKAAQRTKPALPG